MKRIVFQTLVVVGLSATVGRGAGDVAMDKTYSLEEVSIFDCDESIKYRLQSGQAVTDCGNTPGDGITYPALKSTKPIYGCARFNMSLFDPQAGLPYHFVLDESAGAGYDRLYFDVNANLDLTDDAPVGLATKLPDGMRDESGSVLFQNVDISLDYGPDQGVFKQTVMPRMMKSGDTVYMFFTAPTARKGKIQLGSEEVELVLGQTHSISGRYDGPMTGAFLPGHEVLLPLVGNWHVIDGTFYRLLATPAGDEVTVSPYTGLFGTFQLGDPNRSADSPVIDFGYIHSKEALFCLQECPIEDGKAKVPVGDYRPFRLLVRFRKRRLCFAVDTSRLGHADAPAVFPYKIRQDETFALNCSGKPEVVFKTPTTGDRIMVGQTLKAEAMLCDTRAGLMIVGLEDTTKPSNPVTLPGGRKMEMFQSMAPTVKVTNSSGQVVAEGTMPFG